MESVGGTQVTHFTGGTIELHDNPYCTEIYAEGSQQMACFGSNITVALYSPRSTPDGKIYRTIVARLTLPAHGAHAMAVSLFDYLNKIGLNPDGGHSAQ